MYAIPEQFTAGNKAYIASLMEVAQTALAGAERLALLNLNTARSSLQESGSRAAAMLEAKDVKDLVGTPGSVAKPALERIATYSRSVYEINSDTMAELGKLFEGQYAELYKQVSSSLEKAAKNAPAGSDMAVAAVKSALTAASSTYETINKAVKQVVEIADANLSAAASGTMKAVGATEMIPKSRKAAAQAA